MKAYKKDWMFRRMVIRAATRKLRSDEFGMRRPEPKETPLSDDEIFIGVKFGFIKIPPFVSLKAGR